MTTISNDDVQRLASLSGLQLADDEAAGLRQDLDNIVGYIQQLSELDTTGVEPTYQVTGLENVWRDDEVEAGVPADELLALAPDHQQHQVKVPQVL
ncbi:MAG: Asp-tRNA(Asn)/Glu-tRNA(Gln) amidotransferase subunit GatC [Candidatus Saccharibacteria bacterium]|nr:Asp-tRNA(Asn)/Glu-tRNA(Gln) amidotransferase subunit GatC [Candidatus Saccharibacteria bacterium]